MCVLLLCRYMNVSIILWLILGVIGRVDWGSDNSTLAALDLYNNSLITSTSGQALSHLLLNNSSLVKLDLTISSHYQLIII